MLANNLFARALARSPRAVCGFSKMGEKSYGAENSAKFSEPVLAMKPPDKELSSAMRHYLERKRKQDEFMALEQSEFELGKKHLANMMGMEASHMTQDDVDKAIEYLFPSGLAEPLARPMMKPPEEVYPKVKGVEFDNEGRPFSPFFYCLNPKFHKALYDLGDHISVAALFGERMAKQNRVPDPEKVLDGVQLASTRFMTKEEVGKKFSEKINDESYEQLINALSRLLEQPFAYIARDFIFEFRVPITGSSGLQMTNFPDPEYDAEGRAFVEHVGLRKSSVAKVKVSKPGTGRFRVRHIDHMDVECDITYFHRLSDRMCVMYPLQFTRLLGLVDVDCVVDAGGPTGQAGAVRYAMSMCLRPFVDKTTCEEMHVMGLLTQNVRVKERKKPGQEGARRKYTWKKR